jgi:energy-coupling factor transport system substrate-specific component
LFIVLGGYVYGARFGFLLGALTILVSGIVTGGVGPWMPYQMFVAGWTGMAAVLCRPVVRTLTGRGSWVEVLILALYAAVWGLVFGMVMNIWFWPFIGGSESASSGLTWSPGMSVVETLQNYLVFYAITSLVWDAMRMAGNFLLILVFGMPVLRVLRRFHDRFTYTYVPAGREDESAGQDASLAVVPVDQRRTVVTG